MSNYRRYQPYRQRSSQGPRPLKLVVWAGVGVILIILIQNAFRGGSDTNQNANGNEEITLVNGTAPTNASPTTSTAVLPGRTLTPDDCPRLLSTASVDGAYVSLTLNASGIIGDARQAAALLKEKNVPVTLFPTGKWAEDNAEVVRAYVDAGFDVFNRSYANRSYPDLTVQEIRTDLEKAETAIRDVTGVSTKPYFRPPFGNMSDEALVEIRRQGYCAISWTVDSQDWRDGATVEDTKARVLDRLRDGAVILLQANSDIALPLIGPLVDEVRGKGYTFVALDELFRQTGEAASSNVNAAANQNRNTAANSNRASNTNAKNANTNSAKNSNTNGD